VALQDHFLLESDNPKIPPRQEFFEFLRFLWLHMCRICSL